MMKVTRRTALRFAGIAGVATTASPFVQITAAGDAAADAGSGAHSGTPVKLDILYIGAHPDDEASALGSFGQWNEYKGLKTGVITVTRGEGGGNAIGLEEGPALGIIREAEERIAVGYAGVSNIFNLDGLDFYYTASAPLSDRIWGGEALLDRIVRVVRATRPDIIVTMNPSATQGNHGNHQQAAKYAVEAYFAAADPNRFPHHRAEGLFTHRVQRLLRQGATGSGATGPNAVATGFSPTDPSDVVFGAWNGTPSENHGVRWSVMLDKSINAYASQGWASRAPSPTDPARIGVSWFTLIESRTPFYDPKSGDTAALDGVTQAPANGLPPGTWLDVRTSSFDAIAGQKFTMTVEVGGKSMLRGTVTPVLPAGWTHSGAQRVVVPPRRTATVSFVATPAESATPGSRVRVGATLAVGDRSGSNSRIVEVVSPVTGALESLPEIAIFRSWTRRLGVRQLDGLIPTLTSIGSGRSRRLTVTVTNGSSTAQSGTVRLGLPAGFSSEPATRSYSLAANASAEVAFTVTNTDDTLPTSNRAPNDGNYPLDVIVTSSRGTDTQRAWINLVPVLRVQKLAGPKQLTATADGYPGDAIDISTLWEGEPVTPEDLSGSMRVAFDDSNFWVLVDVTDDNPGFWLPPNDIKRPRRVDAVEISIDPRGTSADTSTIFNVAIFPATDDPANGNPPAWARERDNHQGSAADTTPGMEVKSIVREPYTGYTIEAKIPFALMPDGLDPNHVGFNVMVNDSDTPDKVAQSRIAWSSWRGVRADPWRFGLLELIGMAEQPSNPVTPIIPETAARSAESPQSILQSSSDGVPLGGWAALARNAVWLLRADARPDRVNARFIVRARGTLRAFLWQGDRIVGTAQQVTKPGSVNLPVPRSSGSGQLMLLASFEADSRVWAGSWNVG